MSTIQKQHDELSETRELLDAWGAWLRATSVANLNLPSKSNFVIVPGVGASDYCDEDAEVIEEILVHLKRERKLVFKAIEQDYYFNSSTREGADLLNVSHVKYRDLKSSGETFVHAYLLAVRNSNNFKKSA